MEARVVKRGPVFGRSSMHLILVLAHAFLSCQRKAANNPTLSKRVGCSSSVMRRDSSIAEPRASRTRRTRCCTSFESACAFYARPASAANCGGGDPAVIRVSAVRLRPKSSRAELQCQGDRIVAEGADQQAHFTVPLHHHSRERRWQSVRPGFSAAVQVQSSVLLTNPTNAFSERPGSYFS
jgi:hypothetical protein